MNAREIRVGTKLEFEIINSIGSKIGQSFKSELIDIVSDMEIIISYPINESRLMFISVGTKIKVTFLHEIEGVLSFTGVITSKEKNDTQVLLHTTIGDDFKEIQRRNYFRPECNLKSEYRLSKEADVTGKETVNDVCYKKTITQNISNCGACILIDENIPIHSVIDLIVWLTDKRSIKMKCRVTRSIEFTYDNVKKYETGLHLEDMTQLDQNILVKYITDNVTVKGRLIHWDDLLNL